MKRPLVSVLVPVYNTEKYLEKCLDSIIGQTINDMEIICVDDGSTDASAEILREYEKKDGRVRILTKANGGLPSARNAALDAVRGEYVGFVDSDDYIQPDMYEKMVGWAKKNDSDIVICGANIYPQNPRAGQWLYDALSTTYEKYTEYKTELLFDRMDTTPFLWRTLIRKELIDSYSLRLDEDIIIGEDKAFQCKIYPYARGITVIPDKLYNYYWCRPESLMGKRVYGKPGQKVFAHAKLVGRMLDDFGKSPLEGKERAKTQKAYLEWSIPFIYDDFMYLSFAEKCEIAGGLKDTWLRAGYYGHSAALTEWKREAFQYIANFAGKKAAKPRLSLIVPMESSFNYMEEWLRDVKCLVHQNIEILIINNGTSNENYLKLQKLLYHEQCVRLYNTPEHFHYADVLNKGIQLAAGELIAFWNPEDWYQSAELLQRWINCAEKDGADVCTSEYCSKNTRSEWSGTVYAGSDDGKRIFDLDFHDVVFRKDFLLEREIVFTENAILTGFVFWCRAVLKAEKISHFPENVYCLRKMHHADWISTEKCRSVLEGMRELMELSVEKGNPYLHGKVFHLLNGDRLKNIIVNNTRPYCMPVKECPDGENSQIATVSLLFEIVLLADHDMLYACGFTERDSLLGTLYEVINARQKFLAEL